MLEARLVQGKVLRSLVDAVKDLVTEANFDCSSAGLQLQAMDTSHVSLIAMQLRSDAFEHFRCDRPMSMGGWGGGRVSDRCAPRTVQNWGSSREAAPSHRAHGRRHCACRGRRARARQPAGRGRAARA